MLDRIFGKTVPVWLLALTVLLFSLGAIAFGWYVKRSILLSDRTPMARAAIEIASFPSSVNLVLREVGRIVKDETDYTNISAHPPEQQWNGFSPVVSGLSSGPRGLIVRRGPGTMQRGWRILVGTFSLDETVQHAAVLLSPELEIVHYWPLTQDGHEEAAPERPEQVFPHGFVALKDGSIIYTFDPGRALYRKDWCGRTQWVTQGRFSHSVSLDESEKTVWVLRSGSADPDTNRIFQVAVDDGTVVKDFSMSDAIAANPDIDILELKRPHDDFGEANPKGQPGRWTADPFHLNDVEPLPRRLANHFPMFSPGDLLISARETNLIFVLDPATLVIKWWIVGATVRQHDPDWSASGRVSVYDNRTARGYSNIVEIDPATFARTAVVDGRSIDFYSRIRGKHQKMPGGGWVITSAQQGRVIELDAEGNIALEFYIVLKEQGSVFGLVSEAVFLREDAMNVGALVANHPDDCIGKEVSGYNVMTRTAD